MYATSQLDYLVKTRWNRIINPFIIKGEYFYNVARSVLHLDPEDLFKQGKASRIPLMEGLKFLKPETAIKWVGYENYKKHVNPKSMLYPKVIFNHE